MYELTVKNNPLAEVVIKKGDIECLAYGLDKAKEDNKIALRIHEKENSHWCYIFYYGIYLNLWQEKI